MEVTERRSARSIQRSPWRATREFDVSGVSGDYAALNAAGIPNYNEAHPQAGSRLLARTRTVRHRHADLWTVSVVYEQPGNAGAHQPGDEDDPLSEPPLLQWVIEDERVPVDSDFEGRPILNSSRQPFVEPPGDLVGVYGLAVERNELFFDPVLALDFHLALNSDEFTVQGFVLAQPGYARLRQMAPSGPYQLTDPYVRIRYLFDLRAHADSETTPADASPFWVRVLDQGTLGVGLVDGQPRVLQLYDGEDEPIVRSVPLDGGGAPLDPSLRIGHGGHTAAGLDLPSGSILETTEDARFLWYRPKSARSRPFAALGL